MTANLEQTGKHRQQTIEGSPLDQNFRDELNTVAFVDEHVPFNQLPFTQNRDNMTLLALILEELELSPGHFYVANDEEDIAGWIAVVKFDDSDDVDAIVGTGETAMEAIEAVGNALKELYS